jgi:hypothetical protein
MKRKTLFVLVYASDPITTTYLAYEIAASLTPVMQRDPTQDPKDKNSRSIWVFPEPAWTLTDYAAQCQNDASQTAGALVIYDVENDAGVFNWLLYQQTYTHLYVKAFFVNCAAYAPPFQPAQNGMTSFSQQATYNGTPGGPKPPIDATPEPTQTPGYPRVTPTPTTISAPPSTESVTFVYPGPTPTPTSPPTPFPTGLSKTSPVAAQIVSTQTTTIIPKMQVVWRSENEIHDFAHQASVPFLSVAALGAYLASRTYTQQTTVSQTTPLVPGTSTTANGSETVSTQRSGNNSTLPYGVALIATAFPPLASVSFGGSNQTRILKNAASGVATKLRSEIRNDCSSPENANYDSSLCRLFSDGFLYGK